MGQSHSSWSPGEEMEAGRTMRVLTADSHWERAISLRKHGLSHPRA